MKTIQKIRFSVKKDAVEDVIDLIEDYAHYDADYAKKHDESWTWHTYQSTDSVTEFLSIIAHQDGDAEARHMGADGTTQFAKNFYAHVKASEQTVYRSVGSSDA